MTSQAAWLSNESWADFIAKYRRLTARLPALSLVAIVSLTPLITSSLGVTRTEGSEAWFC